jgi:hypothetical protein
MTGICTPTFLRTRRMNRPSDMTSQTRVATAAPLIPKVGMATMLSATFKTRLTTLITKILLPKPRATHTLDSAVATKMKIRPNPNIRSGGFEAPKSGPATILITVGPQIMIAVALNVPPIEK